MPTAHVIVVRPQIATNTGNIIRLCANTGAALHLVEPLGFRLDEAAVKRAGLDYHELTTVAVHRSLDAALAATGTRAFGLTAHAATRYDQVHFGIGDTVVFGSERTGLSTDERSAFDEHQLLRLPMMPDNRSLNLANAIAVTVYELWRQIGFGGADGSGTFAETIQRPNDSTPIGEGSLPRRVEGPLES